MAACYAPGTPWDYVNLIDSYLYITQDDGDEFSPRYQLTTRWRGAQGSPRALTWSFVPDGLSIPGGAGEPTAASNLFARMDALFGGNRSLWISKFQESFDRWAILCGVSYTRIQVGGNPWDDGASWGSAGSANLRGDIRIGMHPIDGTFGILAYNQFPPNGDMVMDSAESWNDSAGNYTFLRNTVMHEHGHGIGLLHVCPANSTKLMEPLLNENFDGPQHDDIRGAQRQYGDDSEDNNTPATATNIGTLNPGTPINLGAVPNPGSNSTWPLSIDADGEVDYFKFTVTSALAVTVTVAPQGFTYQSGPQTGQCNSGTTVNSLAIADLNVQILDTNGTTVLATGASNGAGSSEVTNAALPAAGDYYVKVYEGNSPTESQMYTLRLVGVNPTPPPDPPDPTSNSPQCGPVTITRTDSPPSGVTWFWQGTTCGTATNLGSGATFNATSSGTYYIRARFITWRKR